MLPVKNDNDKFDNSTGTAILEKDSWNKVNQIRHRNKIMGEK
jgi:hypothetical protein